MTVEFPGLGAPSTSTTPSAAQSVSCRPNHASTIATQAQSSSSTKSEGGFFSSVWSCVTFIPRKIWGLIQMILCCGKGGQLSFTDQILKDPKTAAENTIKILEEKGYEEGMKSLEKALANLFLIPENKKALDKVYGWADELRKLAAQSTNTDIKTKLMTDWEALADELDFCRKVADSVAADPRPAAANAMRILENGYDRGKAWIERGFAAVDPKTPAGIAWAKKHGKNFAEFTAGLRANVDGWDKDKLTHIQQEIAQKLPGDLEKIMAPFVAAMKAERE